MDVAILGIEVILLDERLDEEVVRGGLSIAARSVFGSKPEAAEVSGSIERVRTGERGRNALPLLLLILPIIVFAALPLKGEEQQLVGRLLDLAPVFSATFLVGNFALLPRREVIISVLDDLGLLAGHQIRDGIGGWREEAEMNAVYGGSIGVSNGLC